MRVIIKETLCNNKRIEMHYVVIKETNKHIYRKKLTYLLEAKSLPPGGTQLVPYQTHCSGLKV